MAVCTKCLDQALGFDVILIKFWIESIDLIWLRDQVVSDAISLESLESLQKIKIWYVVYAPFKELLDALQRNGIQARSYLVF